MYIFFRLQRLALRLRKFDQSQIVRPKESGMTLIEIMIVIALLGGLMAVLVTNFMGTAEKARIDQARLGFNSIQQGLQMYKIHVGRYPSADQGLRALAANPGDLKAWRGPYLEEKQMKDPWGNEIGYESDGRAFKLQSAGPNGTMGDDDDLFYPETSTPAQ